MSKYCRCGLFPGWQKHFSILRTLGSLFLSSSSSTFFLWYSFSSDFWSVKWQRFVQNVARRPFLNKVGRCVLSRKVDGQGRLIHTSTRPWELGYFLTVVPTKYRVSWQKCRRRPENVVEPRWQKWRHTFPDLPFVQCPRQRYIFAFCLPSKQPFCGNGADFRKTSLAEMAWTSEKPRWQWFCWCSLSLAERMPKQRSWTLKLRVL